MSLSRRDILLTGLGLAATAGCASTATRSAGPAWPARLDPPTAGSGYARPGPTRPIHRVTDASPAPTPASAPAPSLNPAVATVPGVVARANWTRHGLAGQNIRPMHGVSRITLHHEGWTPVTFTAATSTFDRVEQIRQVHTRDRGWADIGYHYVIDRAGRVIEGRSIVYQGAHVTDNNPHNLGILVLGNFNQQSPSSAQVQSLARFTRQMMQLHRVPGHLVQTHQEIKPTECPGRTLQAQVEKLRRLGTLA